MSDAASGGVTVLVSQREMTWNKQAALDEQELLVSHSYGATR